MPSLDDIHAIDAQDLAAALGQLTPKAVRGLQRQLAANRAELVLKGFRNRLRAANEDLPTPEDVAGMTLDQLRETWQYITYFAECLVELGNRVSDRAGGRVF